MNNHDYKPVLNFWFETLSVKDWYKKDPDLDQTIATQFLEIHRAVASGECSHWRETAKGALAEIIVLDQFSRNMFRDTEKAFAFDNLALFLAQFAIANDQDTSLSSMEKNFLYMPYMHSESKKIQAQSITLFGQTNSFATEHKAVIDRFGRFPHRNHILKRQTTEEESLFLQQHTGW
ncbi:MAG: DUF924 family protein [Francisellaceae bacterium]